MRVRALVEVDLTRAADEDPDADLRDLIVDVLIDAFGPTAEVHDLAEEGELAYRRTRL